MRKAIIRIEKDDDAVLSDTADRFRAAWNSGDSQGDVFTFSSPAQLFSVLTPKRWSLIERLQAIGECSLRHLAREIGRDVKRVHEDVRVLIEWGFIERSEAGKILVPFEVIRADFDLRAAA